MFGIKRVVVARHERGLLIKNRDVQEVLQPGIYWVFGPWTRIETYEITVPEFDHELAAFIVKDERHPARRYFDVIELGDREVGLVYKDGKLADVLSPASRRLYWKGVVDVRVEIIAIDEDYAVPKPIVALLARQRPGAFPAQVKDFVYVAEVADKFIGMLIVDGELMKTLHPGLYAYWKFNRRISVEQVDLRLQSMEVSGQEMLTKDKVSLRVNLSATYQVADPVKARSTFHNFVEKLVPMALKYTALASRM